MNNSTWRIPGGGSSQLTTTVPTGNTYLKLTVDDAVDNIHGDIVFQLFNDLTPKTVEKIVGLANGHFYNGLTFHRIINSPTDFMIQGGDPLGTGRQPGIQI